MINTNRGTSAEKEKPVRPLSELLRANATDMNEYVHLADTFRKTWRKQSGKGVLSYDRGFLSEGEAANFLVSFGLADDTEYAASVLEASVMMGHVDDRDPKLLPYQSEGSQLACGIVPHVDKHDSPGYIISKFNFRAGFPG